MTFWANCLEVGLYAIALLIIVSVALLMLPYMATPEPHLCVWR